MKDGGSKPCALLEIKENRGLILAGGWIQCEAGEGVMGRGASSKACDL